MNNLKKNRNPFFILYDARSGSTFLANLLIKKGAIAIPPESNIVTDLIVHFGKSFEIKNNKELKRVLGVLYKDKKFHNWNFSKNSLIDNFDSKLPIKIKAFILEIFDMYTKANFPDATIFGIKKGSYLKYFQDIIKLFPNSKFIGLIRDGRAVFNSKKNSYNSKWEKFETNPFIASRLWCESIRMIRKIEEIYPKTIVIKYEKLIKNPDKVIGLILKFLGVKIHENEHESKKYKIPEGFKHIHKNINKDPKKKRIFAWRKSLSRDEIFAFESLAYKFLLQENYKPIFSRNSLKNPIKQLVNLIKHTEWWLRDFLIFVKNSLKNPVQKGLKSFLKKFLFYLNSFLGE